jgi:hypothetical protein
MEDVITLGGKDITDVPFTYATSISDSYMKANFDGVFGLGWPQQAENGLAQPLSLMYEQGLLEDLSFSLYLTKNANKSGSLLQLGGKDEIKSIKMEYIPLETPISGWNIKTHSIEGNSITVDNSSVLVSVDSMSRFIYGTQTLILDIMNKLGIKDFGEIPCTEAYKYPSLKFIFEKNSITP